VPPTYPVAETKIGVLSDEILLNEYAPEESAVVVCVAPVTSVNVIVAFAIGAPTEAVPERLELEELEELPPPPQEVSPNTEKKVIKKKDETFFILALFDI
jgi:hypothetical protein